MIYDVKPLIGAMKLAIRDYVAQHGEPSLDIVKTSDDYASKKYIGNKIALGQELGINVRVIRPEEMKTSVADGMIVQLPVGGHWNEDTLVNSVPKNADVDGFHLEHLGEIMKNGESYLEPCTARGVVQIISKFFDNELSGKNVVIINRSNIVGKPLAMMLIAKDCTVTVCHSKTPFSTLLRHTREADVVVTAVGKPNFITRGMLKTGALVVDVGICRDENGKLCGDVGKNVKKSPDVWTTPVPGGVGQFTVLNLLHNTILAMVKKQ